MAKDVLGGRSIVRRNIFDTVNQTTAQIKADNPIVEYFISKGVKLKKTNGNGQYSGLCPFHKDTEPSLSVNSTKGVFNCFGCEKSGSVIDAVCFYENVGTGEAIRLLKSNKSGEQNNSILPLASKKQTGQELGCKLLPIFLNFSSPQNLLRDFFILTLP